MEGYLVRIPRDAWQGNNEKRLALKGASKRCVQARLLYYTLGEGFLRGYLSPDDDEPVDTFQLTSYHVEMDVMYSMLMFEAFVIPKVRKLSVAAMGKTAQHGTVDSDDSSDDEDTNRTPASETDQESSILFFAANKEWVKTWSTRVLNWNRYVFGSFDSPDPDTLKASKQELVDAFHQNCCASWFYRPLSLKSEEATPSTHRGSTSSGFKFMPSIQGASASTKSVDDGLKPTNAPVPKPWWMLNPPNTRRISSNSLRK